MDGLVPYVHFTQVMIVNVNPYDTGYDENSHVMKFAALAREVHITPHTAPIHKTPAVLNVKQQNSKARTYTSTRRVTISVEGEGRVQNDTVLEVLEGGASLLSLCWCSCSLTVDEPNESMEEEEEAINPLVDALFDEIEDLRAQVDSLNFGINESDMQNSFTRVK
jgi:kinesin family member 20